jgi:Glu-tRNA(Gln) amidotransferase subunit E-like FAD-binding protein
MSIDEIFKISGAILGSVGGAAVIIVGLSSWLGKVWANRILEKDKLAYSSELERIKNQLHTDAEKRQFIFSLYFEGQFKLYNDLWVSLAGLQNEVEKLWEEASTRNLKTFVTALTKAKQQIRNSALLIDQVHYKEIMEVIENLENYHVGKERLINTRRNIENVSQGDVQEIIEQNRHNREKINTFVEHMLDEMRSQVSGKRNIS